MRLGSAIKLINVRETDKVLNRAANELLQYLTIENVDVIMSNIPLRHGDIEVVSYDTSDLVRFNDSGEVDSISVRNIVDDFNIVYNIYTKFKNVANVNTDDTFTNMFFFRDEDGNGLNKVFNIDVDYNLVELYYKAGFRFSDAEQLPEFNLEQKFVIMYRVDESYRLISYVPDHSIIEMIKDAIAKFCDVDLDNLEDDEDDEIVAVEEEVITIEDMKDGKTIKGGLGKGLGALIPDNESEVMVEKTIDKVIPEVVEDKTKKEKKTHNKK